MLRHRKKHSNALNHMNNFQGMKSENGENNGSSINNSASDMSDDESSTIAMINNKKLMEMMPGKAEPTQFNKELFMKLQEKFFSMQAGSNLLGNLLGISDQSVLNRMFSAPADEAAKMLGVEK